MFDAGTFACLFLILDSGGSPIVDMPRFVATEVMQPSYKLSNPGPARFDI